MDEELRDLVAALEAPAVLPSLARLSLKDAIWLHDHSWARNRFSREGLQLLAHSGLAARLTSLDLSDACPEDAEALLALVEGLSAWPRLRELALCGSPYGGSP
jgi:Ran GTPase-activating protein (RanGAP) involved in mRNA processing and transport